MLRETVTVCPRPVRSPSCSDDLCHDLANNPQQLQGRSRIQARAGCCPLIPPSSVVIGRTGSPIPDKQHHHHWSLPENRFTTARTVFTMTALVLSTVHSSSFIPSPLQRITVVLQWYYSGHHSGTQCHTVHRSARD